MSITTPIPMSIPMMDILTLMSIATATATTMHIPMNTIISTTMVMSIIILTIAQAAAVIAKAAASTLPWKN